MILIVSGAMVASAGGAGLWYFMPRDGRTHPLATATLLESLIPVGIVAAIGAGAALIISGVASF